MTTNMERRRSDFIGGSHSEGILFRILNRYTAIRSTYDGARCVYSYCPLDCKQAAIEHERRLIKENVLAFGEAPPLNSAIPDRHNYDEWSELFNQRNAEPSNGADA